MYSDEKDEVVDTLAVLDAIDRVKQIQDDIDYKALALAKQSPSSSSLKNIPGLTKMLQGISHSGMAVTEAGDQASHIDPTSTNLSISQGFHFATLALAAFDFIRIPVIYLSAYLLKQQVPINLTNNARWLYSVALISLTVAALIVPAIAPVVAFVVAAAGLALSTLLLGRALYDRYHLGKERKRIMKEILREEDEMDHIKEQAKHLEHLLATATESNHIAAIFTDIARLQEEYQAQKQLLEDLHTKQVVVEQKIKKLGIVHILDKSLSVAFGSIAIIGLVVALFFPPIGIAIVAGAALASATYFVARITTPLFKSLGNWFMKQFKKSPEAEAIDESQEDEPLLDSTAEAFVGLQHQESSRDLLSSTHSDNNAPRVRSSSGLAASAVVLNSVATEPLAEPELLSTIHHDDSTPHPHLTPGFFVAPAAADTKSEQHPQAEVSTESNHHPNNAHPHPAVGFFEHSDVAESINNDDLDEEDPDKETEHM